MIQDAAAWIFGLIGGNQDRLKPRDLSSFGLNSMNLMISVGTILKYSRESDREKSFNKNL